MEEQGSRPGSGREPGGPRNLQALTELRGRAMARRAGQAALTAENPSPVARTLLQGIQGGKPETPEPENPVARKFTPAVWSWNHPKPEMSPILRASRQLMSASGTFIDKPPFRALPTIPVRDVAKGSFANDSGLQRELKMWESAHNSGIELLESVSFIDVSRDLKAIASFSPDENNHDAVQDIKRNCDTVLSVSTFDEAIITLSVIQYDGEDGNLQQWVWLHFTRPMLACDEAPDRLLPSPSSSLDIAIPRESFVKVSRVVHGGYEWDVYRPVCVPRFEFERRPQDLYQVQKNSFGGEGVKEPLYLWADVRRRYSREGDGLAAIASRVQWWDALYEAKTRNAEQWQRVFRGMGRGEILVEIKYRPER